MDEVPSLREWVLQKMAEPFIKKMNSFVMIVKGKIFSVNIKSPFHEVNIQTLKDCKLPLLKACTANIYSHIVI